MEMLEQQAFTELDHVDVSKRCATLVRILHGASNGRDTAHFFDILVQTVRAGRVWCRDGIVHLELQGCVCPTLTAVKLMFSFCVYVFCVYCIYVCIVYMGDFAA